MPQSPAFIALGDGNYVRASEIVSFDYSDAPNQCCYVHTSDGVTHLATMQPDKMLELIASAETAVSHPITIRALGVELEGQLHQIVSELRAPDVDVHPHDGGQNAPSAGAMFPQELFPLVHEALIRFLAPLFGVQVQTTSTPAAAS